MLLSAARNYERRSILSITLLNDVTSFGVLHTPRLSPPYPLVIILHGLASNKIGTKRSYIYLAEELAKIGIATLRVDLPGHGDSEYHLLDFSLEDYKTSVWEIISYAFSQSYTDTENVAIFGSSLGGTLALLNIAAFPKVKSLALWAPTILGALWLQETLSQPKSEVTTKDEEVLYAGVPINKTFCSQFIDLQALQEAHLFSPALSILYMQGQQDSLVSLQHQKLFQEAFINKSNPVDIRTYPNVDHTFACTNTSVFSDLIQWLQCELTPQD
ncbi:alpha/beta hydrolase [Chlamydia pecorum]|uniref:alpha/beta hydrolase n=1 Tax=Chlamydia pecorum TaxID=85991 RepID=UPI0003ADA6A3|nr:alpha/beta hydrolase [Chlamydia pecorum]AGW38993.1 dienelactone hydrolase family protein [Chlamydia pecorum W73]AGW39919.1 dienelactone hydrolase family protein [Chlamydia pecorum P787]ETF37238.1 dienelactone hydrolase family protein [Chlamydia pecorum DBDeUG]ETF37645.1 dienelactone hydrolase family protein [Chlamydia pecorum VR629]ETF39458.1 dienelactone hydrolase family protein [Chlamydia pecorum IPTaLE]